MITMFNRRELTTTYDIDKQSEIRKRRSAHQIDYVIENPSAPFLDPYRSRTEYKFYVKKCDYEDALESSMLSSKKS